MKTYIVVRLYETDGEPSCSRMTAEQIRKYVARNTQEGFWIIDGEILKHSNGKIDLTKL